MVKLVVLYRQPEDAGKFNDHYFQVHLPLARQIPGLERLEVTRIRGNAMGGEAEYHLLAEMYFKDEDAYRAAMKSQENKVAAKDVMGFAGDIVYMMVGDVVED
ncbi:ethyl tert-butyl ether degradation protein EthD [Alicyclobacillus contaminans]|uniref:EthD family reductase n=1 Tax=Alicyclobacillus contaminans TaxID=392016 RepID=UPI0004103239|nr:EthD family reductase [Alicyclobacillus contaminans]GMA49381.1 ethyl tert-butyl ether degradation protein EthD [Alicyclobacillus contaminans]